MAKYNNGRFLTIPGIQLPVFSIHIYTHKLKRMNGPKNKQNANKQGHHGSLLLKV